jgi:DNA-binding NarL/FixJ family response regulator
MIRVLVADDHPLVRQGVRQTRGEVPDISVGREAIDGREVMEAARQGDCDVLLLDVTMPGMHGLDVLKLVKRDHPSLPVLVLTMHSEEQFAVRALRAGAAGYLTKDALPSELVRAIRKVCTGGRYVSANLAERLAQELAQGGEGALHDRLSDREYQVMCLLARGKSVGDIAAELALSVKTISTFRARILEKMNLRTNAELIHYAIRNRLVESP